MGDERGMSQSVSWAVLAPLVLGVILLAIAAGVHAHAKSAAQQAAMAGAERAAAVYGDCRQGVEVAKRLADRAGLKDVEIRFDENPSSVRLELIATTNSPLPGPLSRVEAQAFRPKEF